MVKTISSTGVGNKSMKSVGKGLLPVPSHLYAGQPLMANSLTVARFANIDNLDTPYNIASSEQ